MCRQELLRPLAAFLATALLCRCDVAASSETTFGRGYEGLSPAWTDASAPNSPPSSRPHETTEAGGTERASRVPHPTERSSSPVPASSPPLLNETNFDTRAATTWPGPPSTVVSGGPAALPSNSAGIVPRRFPSSSPSDETVPSFRSLPSSSPSGEPTHSPLGPRLSSELPIAEPPSASHIARETSMEHAEGSNFESRPSTIRPSNRPSGEALESAKQEQEVTVVIFFLVLLPGTIDMDQTITRNFASAAERFLHNALQHFQEGAFQDLVVTDSQVAIHSGDKRRAKRDVEREHRAQSEFLVELAIVASVQKLRSKERKYASTAILHAFQENRETFQDYLAEEDADIFAGITISAIDPNSQHPTGFPSTQNSLITSGPSRSEFDERTSFAPHISPVRSTSAPDYSHSAANAGANTANVISHTAALLLELTGATALMDSETSSFFEDVALAFVNNDIRGGTEVSSFLVIDQALVAAGIDYLSKEHAHRHAMSRPSENEMMALQVESSVTGVMPAAAARGFQNMLQEIFEVNFDSFLGELAAGSPFFFDLVTTDDDGSEARKPTNAPTDIRDDQLEAHTIEVVARQDEDSPNEIVIGGASAGVLLTALLLAVGMFFTRFKTRRNASKRECKAKVKNQVPHNVEQPYPVQRSRSKPESGLDYSSSDLASVISSLSDVFGDAWSYSAELDGTDGLDFALGHVEPRPELHKSVFQEPQPASSDLPPVQKNISVEEESENYSEGSECQENKARDEREKTVSIERTLFEI